MFKLEGYFLNLARTIRLFAAPVEIRVCVTFVGLMPRAERLARTYFTRLAIRALALVVVMVFDLSIVKSIVRSVFTSRLVPRVPVFERPLNVGTAELA